MWWVGSCKQILDKSKDTHSLLILYRCRLSTLLPQPWYQGPTNLVELSETMFRAKVCPDKKKYVSSSPPSTTTSPSSSTTTRSTSPIHDINGPRITELNNQGSEDHKVKYWVVMLYANWSVACLNFEAVLAKLSLRYDAGHIKFGKYAEPWTWVIAWDFSLTSRLDTF